MDAGPVAHRLIELDPGAVVIIREGKGIVGAAPGLCRRIKARGVAEEIVGAVRAVGALGIGIHGKGSVPIGIERPGVEAEPGIERGLRQKLRALAHGAGAAAQIIAAEILQEVLLHAVVGRGGRGSDDRPQHVVGNLAGDGAILHVHGCGGQGRGGAARVGAQSRAFLTVGQGIPAVGDDDIGLADFHSVCKHGSRERLRIGGRLRQAGAQQRQGQENGNPSFGHVASPLLPAKADDGLCSSVRLLRGRCCHSAAVSLRLLYHDSASDSRLLCLIPGKTAPEKRIPKQLKRDPFGSLRLPKNM